MTDRAELVEKVAKAIADTQDEDWDNPALFLVDLNDTAESGREAYRDMASAALDLVLEEAVRVADDYSHSIVGARIAAALRALKSSA